jgi:hypothetical protein
MIELESYKAVASGLMSDSLPDYRLMAKLTVQITIVHPKVLHIVENGEVKAKFFEELNLCRWEWSVR